MSGEFSSADSADSEVSLSSLSDSLSSSSSSAPVPPYFGPPVVRYASIQLAYKTEAEWTVLNPKPKAGQFCINTDGRFKIGNGTDFWLTLTYHTHDWSELSGKPLVFPPDTHSHGWSEIADKPTTFAPAAHTHTWSEVTDKPATYPPDVHTHAWSGITDKPTTFAPEAHTHPWSEVTDKPALSRGTTIVVTGKPDADEVIAVPVVTGINEFVLAASGAGISAVAQVAATAETVCLIKKNSDTVVTLTWAAAGTVATVAVSAETTFAGGDLLSVVFGAVPDATLANIGITIGGARA